MVFEMTFFPYHQINHQTLEEKFYVFIDNMSRINFKKTVTSKNGELLMVNC